MLNTIGLEEMGVKPLSGQEIQEIEGGLPKWMQAFGVGWLVNQVISNWDDIKEGAKEGWDSVQYK